MKTAILFVISLYSLSPIFVSAEPVIGSAVNDYSSDVLRVILSLGLVLFIFYIGVIIFKKYVGGSVQASTSMKILGAMSLTPKDKLLIIEAGGSSLLLGVSSNGITKLHTFDKGDLKSSEQEVDQSNVSFSSHLQKILNKKSS
jgi:flagellar protein FliO/FliZ